MSFVLFIIIKKTLKKFAIAIASTIELLVFVSISEMVYLTSLYSCSIKGHIWIASC